MKIAHLSDPHFGTEVAHALPALQAVLAELQIDLIVVSGDITQRARSAQFAAAKKFIDSLPSAAPPLLVPGNHDLPLFNLPMRLLRPTAGYRRVFGATEQQRQVGNVAVVGADTTLRTRLTRGRLALAGTRRRIAAATQGARLRLLVVHQPLHTRLDVDRDECLIGAADAAAACSREAVDLVLSGHVHMPLLDTTRATFPGLSRHFILSGAGTVVSRRVRSGAPNSFNLIDAADEGGTVRLTLYSLDERRGPGFRPEAQASFRLAADGWMRVPDHAGGASHDPGNDARGSDG